MEAFDVKVGLDKPKQWAEQELDEFDSRVGENAARRSPQQRIKTKPRNTVSMTMKK